MARLFLAISLPAQVKERLAEVQRELARSGADVRWVRPEGIHLTLKFLGEVPPEKIEAIVAACEKAVKEAAPGALRLGVRGLGTFPPNRAPRVVWAGLTGDLTALARLKRALEEALVSLGFEREDRPFVPHLTLGRVKSARRREALLKEIARFREEEFFSPESIEVCTLTLYQSTLHPEGAIYTALRKIPLASN